LSEAFCLSARLFQHHGLKRSPLAAVGLRPHYSGLCSLDGDCRLVIEGLGCAGHQKQPLTAMATLKVLPKQRSLKMIGARLAHYHHNHHDSRWRGTQHLEVLAMETEMY
jgi:hypothetical protein